MKWIGLTGGIATGESTVSRLLREKGFDVVDADQLAREVVLPGTLGHAEVVQAFGPDAVHANGELDRKKIGAVVFSDPSKLSLLESIIRPKVRALALEKKLALESSGKKIAFYDVPLLFEKKMQELFDLVVVVFAAPESQLERLVRRDGHALEEAQRRIGVQVPIDQKVAMADEVVRNIGTLEDLRVEVDRLLSRLSAS